MTTGHTKGTLFIPTPTRIQVQGTCPPQIVACTGMGWSYHENVANAKHIVATWNACDGINPEAVPGLLAALKDEVRHCQDNGYEVSEASLAALAQATATEEV